MSEVKDPKIKLFGKTIGVVETAPQSGGAVSIHVSEPAAEDQSNQEPPCSSDSMLEDGDLNRDVEEKESRESLSGCKQDYAKDEHQSNPPTSKELKDSSDSRPMTEDPNPPSSETEAESEKMIKNEDDRNESSEKTLKKPEKIIPCPRCNSMDTKFCYFNNYNVNQPRHFCKNCQRYWTAGGTMRNVPIGAGRRKNKNSVSQFRHLNVPDALQSGRVDLNGIHHPALNPNGAVLTFGTDSPLCESMAAVLNIADKTIGTGSRNAFQRPEEVEISASDRSKERMNDSSSRSSTTASSSKDEVGKNNCQPFPQQMLCYAGGPPWPYMWNPLQWKSSMPPPAFAPPSFPVPFYSATPPPYWACSVPGPWNAPWVISPTSAPSQSHTPPSSSPNSPTLGKHSRDENIQKVGSTKEGGAKERNLWVPKTLRIDDPGEAAKSSIWETLGIKKDKVEGVGGGAIFKAFQTRYKCDEKSHASENSTVLQANPAAFSRSLSFHERT